MPILMGTDMMNIKMPPNESNQALQGKNLALKQSINVIHAIRIRRPK